MRKSAENYEMSANLPIDTSTEFGGDYYCSSSQAGGSLVGSDKVTMRKLNERASIVFFEPYPYPNFVDRVSLLGEKKSVFDYPTDPNFNPRP